MPLIRFNYADVKPIVLHDKNVIKKFVADIFVKEGRKFRRIDYIFCSDEFLLQINKSFLRHDFYTDVVTFDLSEGEETTGEVYISVDRVKENALTNGATYRNEILRVVFHAALHLCGYDDKKKSEKTIMRGKEDYYLQVFQEKL